MSPELSGHHEGDILKPPKTKLGRNGLFSNAWTYGQIPYVIDESFSDYEFRLIHRAFAEYQTKTCVRFVPKESYHVDYVSIEKNGNGCYSYVGQIGFGKQVMGASNYNE